MQYSEGIIVHGARARIDIRAVSMLHWYSLFRYGIVLMLHLLPL